MVTSPAITPAEKEAYEELLYYTLSHGGPEFIHQYAVDAWTAQHANAQTRPIALMFALVGLYLHQEMGLTGRQVQKMHMGLAQQKEVWPTLSLPEERGSTTVREVVAAPPGPERDQALDAWCESVWRAYCESREQVVEWLGRRGIG